MDPLGNVRWQHSPWTREILSTCRKVVPSEIGCAEASRSLAAFAVNVYGERSVPKDWEIFDDVEFATSELPFGEARKHSSPEMLRAKDEELRAIENFYSKRVLDAALKLLEDAKETDTQSNAV